MDLVFLLEVLELGPLLRTAVLEQVNTSLLTWDMLVMMHLNVFDLWISFFLLEVLELGPLLRTAVLEQVNTSLLTWDMLVMMHLNVFEEYILLELNHSYSYCHSVEYE